MSARHPRPTDGARIWSLIDRIGVLERNTPYFYALFCLDFADTCLVSETDGDLDGFVVGYRPPQRPEALFVWQVGVAPHARGRGLATRLILELLRRTPEGVEVLEATVAPDNAPSEALFRGLARTLEVECREDPWMSADLFPGQHPPEHRFRIGPFERPSLRRVFQVQSPRSREIP